VDGAQTVPDAAKAAIAVVVDAMLGWAEPFFIGNLMPWGVKEGIQRQGAGLVTVTDDNTLPVTIRLGGKDYIHNLTQDFVAGLQDYYRYAGDTIGVLVSGTALETHYLRDHESQYNSYQADNGKIDIPYRVTFIQPGQDPGDGDARAFTSLDYIRGATTAALWRGEDVHTRVSNLRHIDAMMKRHSLTV
jgi:hypothetical protein